MSERPTVNGPSTQRTQIGVWAGGVMGMFIGAASLFLPGVSTVVVAGPLAVIFVWLGDRIRRR